MKLRFLGMAAVLSASIGLTNTHAQGPAFGIDYTFGTEFSGTNRNQSGFFPPDTMGAIGPNHYAEMINGAYAVYNKSNGSLVQRISLDQFWSNNSGVAVSNFSFDPRIYFDSSSSRWFAVAVDASRSTSSGFLVAVSSGTNPTLNGSGAAGWSRFRFAADGTTTAGSHWADYPTMGITNSALTIAANMFAVTSGSTFTQVVVVPKSDLTGGTPTIANRTAFQDISGGTTGFTNHPITDVSGTLTEPSRFLSAYNKPAGSLRVTAVGGTAAAPTAPAGFGANTGFISVTARNDPPVAPQSGANDTINTGDSRFSGSVVHVNGEYWAVHSVSVNSRSALEWYRINASTNGIIESGLISDPARSFYYGSIAANGQGEVVIGFSGSSDAEFVGGFVSVGRTANYAFNQGTTSFGPVAQTVAGLANYNVVDGSGRNRWGDYSATQVDPSNPDSFWTIQEFASATNTWQTRITQINISAVPEPATVAMIGMGISGIGLAYLRRKRSMKKQLDAEVSQ